MNWWTCLCEGPGRLEGEARQAFYKGTESGFKTGLFYGCCAGAAGTILTFLLMNFFFGGN
jgi:hypothetical protein